MPLLQCNQGWNMTSTGAVVWMSLHLKERLHCHTSYLFSHTCDRDLELNMEHDVSMQVLLELFIFWIPRDFSVWLYWADMCLSPKANRSFRKGIFLKTAAWYKGLITSCLGLVLITSPLSYYLQWKETCIHRDKLRKYSNVMCRWDLKEGASNRMLRHMWAY